MKTLSIPYDAEANIATSEFETPIGMNIGEPQRTIERIDRRES
jgi:hypothetical protein